MSPFSLGDKFANWASAVLDCPQELDWPLGAQQLSLVHDAMAATHCSPCGCADACM